MHGPDFFVVGKGYRRITAQSGGSGIVCQQRQVCEAVIVVRGERQHPLHGKGHLVGVGDDPDPDPEARVELAIMMMSVGRDEDALSQVNQVLLEQPGNMDALRLMALINFRVGHFDVRAGSHGSQVQDGTLRADVDGMCEGLTG